MSPLIYIYIYIRIGIGTVDVEDGATPVAVPRSLRAPRAGSAVGIVIGVLPADSERSEASRSSVKAHLHSVYRTHA